jgi:hypothetical protein
MQDQPLENNQPLYIRVLKEHFPSFLHKPVTILGSIHSLSNQRIQITLSPDQSPLHGTINDPVLARTIQALEDQPFIEFRGILQNNNMILIEQANGFETVQESSSP